MSNPCSHEASSLFASSLSPDIPPKGRQADRCDHHSSLASALRNRPVVQVCDTWQRPSEGLALIIMTFQLVGCFVAGGLGFEPRLAESESAVLPLDDPPTKHLESGGFLGITTAYDGACSVRVPFSAQRGLLLVHGPTGVNRRLVHLPPDSRAVIRRSRACFSSLRRPRPAPGGCIMQPPGESVQPLLLRDQLL